MKYKSIFIKPVIALVLLASILILTSCFKRVQVKEPLNNDASKGSNIKLPDKEQIKEPVVEIDPIKEQIMNMTIDEKIGQMLIAGFDGQVADSSAAALIKEKHIGGLILFSRNISNSEQLLSLVNSLKKANSINRIPLFISIDEEGGRVSRMPSEIHKLPDNRTIGKFNNSEFSYKIGGILAEETKAFGFNMDFAPVLDINSNPDNPVIGDRSFGSDAETVSKLGLQTMKGLHDGGIIPVVKHFPGHGDTSVDSHIGLPSVNHDINRLNKIELVPFKAAIDNKADALMVAHILLNKLDPQYPASLSKIIISDILRKQMNFTGVVITDDITMGAIMKNYEIGQAAVMAVIAGNDIVLVCHGYDNIITVHNALIKAVNNGTIAIERLDESVYRILKLKQKYELSDTSNNPVNIDKINSNITAVINNYIH